MGFWLRKKPSTWQELGRLEAGASNVVPIFIYCRYVRVSWEEASHVWLSLRYQCHWGRLVLGKLMLVLQRLRMFFWAFPTERCETSSTILAANWSGAQWWCWERVQSVISIRRKNCWCIASKILLSHFYAFSHQWFQVTVNNLIQQYNIDNCHHLSYSYYAIIWATINSFTGCLTV